MSRKEAGSSQNHRSYSVSCVVTAFYDSTHCQIIPFYVLFSRKVSTRSFRIGIKIDSLFWDKNGLDYDCRFVFYSERIIVER